MNWLFVFLAVFLVWLIYGGLVLFFSWPIFPLSVEKLGQIGGTFGALNALFSGLAMVGVVITVYLQRKELSLQRIELSESRKQFARTADAQEMNVRLMALSELLREYGDDLSTTNTALHKTRRSTEDQLRFSKEQAKLIEKKKKIVAELEFVIWSARS